MLQACLELRMDPTGFIKEHVDVFKDFSATHRRISRRSRVRSVEVNEAIMHRGEEATHSGVVLSGMVAADTGNGERLGELKPGDSSPSYLMSGNPCPQIRGRIAV